MTEINTYEKHIDDLITQYKKRINISNPRIRFNKPESTRIGFFKMFTTLKLVSDFPDENKNQLNYDDYDYKYL